MPITIQELVASDTLSQAVDKINFNFDQLLLNGGGPVGPAGIPGPTGPVGGRGLRGSIWYEDNTTTPGTDPNLLVILGLNENDNFLQSNGQVWVYNGTVWVQTVINLTGPQGAAGLTAGFSYIGGFPTGNVQFGRENVAFPIPIPSGVSGGATQLNQGVSTVLLGGVGSTAAAPPPGITYNSAFQIPNVIAGSLDASIVSVLVHQKDSSSSSIVFMGGGEVPADNYEQNILTNLSNISLGTDDQFIINVPKSATVPTSLVDLIGFTVNTLSKGQQYRAGKQINFISGTDQIPSGFGGEVSDVLFTVNSSNPSILAKFGVVSTHLSAGGLFEIGGNILLTSSTGRQGRALLDTGEIRLTANQNIKLNLTQSNFVELNPTRINVTHPTVIRMGTVDGSLNAALIEVGTPQQMPAVTTRAGRIRLESGEVRLIVKDKLLLTRNPVQFVDITSANINIRHSSTIILENSTGFPALIQIGNTGAIPQSTTKNGNIRIEAGFSSIVGQTIRLGRNNTNFIQMDNNGIFLESDEAVEIAANLNLPQVGVSSSNPQVLVRNANTGFVERLPGSPFVPVGIIVMWSGSPTSLPSGWVLCNGQTQNNIQTPDLRGRFILGLDPGGEKAFSPPNGGTMGAVGGEKDVFLNAAQIPPHSHLYKDTMFSEELDLTISSNQGAQWAGWLDNKDILHSGRGRNSSTDTKGTIVYSYSKNRNTSNSGIGASHNNLPPYYVIAYIMYVGAPIAVPSLPSVPEL